MQVAQIMAAYDEASVLEKLRWDPDKLPYRFSDRRSPSPDHWWDSATTLVNKCLYRAMARWVLTRWRRFVKNRKRARKWERLLEKWRILPRHIQNKSDIRSAIAKYL